MFCATGDNGHGGSFGAGDHWTDHPPSQVTAPVAVTYRLYDMHGTPLDTSDDGAPIATLHYDPGTKTMGDFSGDFGTPANSTDPNGQDCSTNPAHNHWVPLASGLGQGMYRVNVNTTVDAGNANVGAENLFSIYVNATGGKARVYGGGRMVAYANMDAATELVLLRPDRGGPRRQDDGHLDLRPGRVVRRRVPPDQEPGRQRLQQRQLQLERPTTAGPGPGPRSRPRSAAPPSSTTTW